MKDWWRAGGVRAGLALSLVFAMCASSVAQAVEAVAPTSTYIVTVDGDFNDVVRGELRDAGITIDDEFEYAFHLVPSGILNPNIIGIIGNGCVINLSDLKDEIEIDTITLDFFIEKHDIGNIDFIKIDDILYFESDGRYTIIHLMDQTTFFVSKNIGEYDKILAPNYFFRIHKKYLINLKYIININNSDGSNCELVGNLTLPVAKRRKEDLVSFLNIK